MGLFNFLKGEDGAVGDPGKDGKDGKDGAVGDPGLDGKDGDSVPACTSGCEQSVALQLLGNESFYSRFDGIINDRVEVYTAFELNNKADKSSISSLEESIQELNDITDKSTESHKELEESIVDLEGKLDKHLTFPASELQDVICITGRGTEFCIKRDRLESMKGQQGTGEGSYESRILKGFDKGVTTTNPSSEKCIRIQHEDRTLDNTEFMCGNNTVDLIQLTSVMGISRPFDTLSTTVAKNREVHDTLSTTVGANRTELADSITNVSKVVEANQKKHDTLSTAVGANKTELAASITNVSKVVEANQKANKKDYDTLQREVNSIKTELFEYKNGEGARADGYLNQAKGEIDAFELKFSRCGTRSSKSEWQRKCSLLKTESGCRQFQNFKDLNASDQCVWGGSQGSLWTYGHVK